MGRHLPLFHYLATHRGSNRETETTSAEETNHIDDFAAANLEVRNAAG